MVMEGDEEVFIELKGSRPLNHHLRSKNERELRIVHRQGFFQTYIRKFHDAVAVFENIFRDIHC